MARHNYVSVIAFVSSEPKFKDVLDGKIGVIELTTIMGLREYEKAKSGYQLNSVVFQVKSTDPEIVRVMEALEINDIVDVTGFIATYDTDKRAECPCCHIINRRVEACVKNGNEKSGGNEIYVYPITMSYREHFDSSEDVYAYLHEHREDVNRVMILGNLTRQPISGNLNEGKRIYTRFQVAINRKFCAKNGADVEKREDYPWVYSYGEKAVDDYETLEKGDLVFIDGALQSRKYKEKYICSNCGEEFEVRGRTLEVLAYDTEYLRLHSYEENNNTNSETTE